MTGFTETFVMATGFLVVCLLAGLLVPKTQSAPDGIEAAHGAEHRGRRGDRGRTRMRALP